MRRPGTVEQIVFAAVLLFGFLLAQGRLATGTWAWCQASESYSCHVWITLYDRGGIE